MGTIDNGGEDARSAIVTKAFRLAVEAEASAREFFISKDNGQVYHGVSTFPAAGINDNILYIRNTSPTRLLFIGEIILTSDLALRFTVNKVTGDAVGTDVIPQNLNMTVANVAEVEFKADAAITGIVDSGKPLFVCRSLAGSSRLAAFRDTLILGQNQAIAIKTDQAADIDITLDFHLE